MALLIVFRVVVQIMRESGRLDLVVHRV
jgi:hypothetical protein